MTKLFITPLKSAGVVLSGVLVMSEKVVFQVGIALVSFSASIVMTLKWSDFHVRFHVLTKAVVSSKCFFA